MKIDEILDTLQLSESNRIVFQALKIMAELAEKIEKLEKENEELKKEVHELNLHWFKK